MIRTHALTLSFILTILTMLSAAALAYSRTPETGFLNRTLRLAGKTHPYQVYVPTNWTRKKKSPVVLFLHGAGERGEDGLIQTEVGIGTSIRRWSDRVPAIVVFPQCPKTRWWTEPEMQTLALKALDKAVAEFNGDASRLYLTGLSMGGYGTWAIAANNPGRFAALAVICGGVRLPRTVPRNPEQPPEPADPYTPIAQKIAKTPVWAFHGAADPVVPVSESRKMVEALKAAGGNVKYSEYEGVRHDSWIRAYSEPEFFSWLLSHSVEAPVKTKRARGGLTGAGPHR